MSFNQRTISLLGNHQNHFWFNQRNLLLKKYINLRYKNRTAGKIRILEIGCGGCQISNYLYKGGYDVSATDIHLLSKKFLTGSIDFFIHNIETDDIDISQQEEYDCIILADVLEHIKTPNIAFINALKFLKKRGLVLVTLPALNILWSEYDRISGHHLRYNRQLAGKIFQNSGCIVTAMEYFMILPAILLFIQRKLLPKVGHQNQNYQDALEINPILNSLMKAWLKIESGVSNYIHIPFGSSLIIAGQKLH